MQTLEGLAAYGSRAYTVGFDAPTRVKGAEARERELALRAAIGASPGRLVQQLFTEMTILSIAAGALGLLVAAAVIRALPALAPRDFPRLGQLHLDGGVALVAAALTIATALLWRSGAAVARADQILAAPLHGAGDGSTAGGFRGERARRLRDALLVAQSAFAVLLIVGAALVGRSFNRLVHVDGGYDVNVLSARLYMPAGLAPLRGGRPRFARSCIRSARTSRSRK